MIDYLFYGLVLGVIGVVCFILGYVIRAAQCGPCSEEELEPLDEIEQAQRDTAI